MVRGVLRERGEVSVRGGEVAAKELVPMRPLLQEGVPGVGGDW